jgi:diguanylate cyclase (GGDEF)-like protein
MRQENRTDPQVVVRELEGEAATVQELLEVLARGDEATRSGNGTLYVLRLFELSSRIARVIYRLKQAHVAAKIILVLNRCNDEETFSSFAAGVDDVLVSPFDETMLGIKVMLQSNLLLRDLERTREIAALHKRIEKLQGLALRDPILGIPNRRAFESALKREWSRHQRSELPLALIFCDIDYFKAYNDTFGHPTGDVALRRVADCLKQEAQRETDLVCRYGGEEFVVLLSDTNTSGALSIARRMRAAVAHLGIEHRGSPVTNYLSMSFGVACVVPVSGNQSNELVMLADNALYHAKSAGRNSVFAHDQRQISVREIGGVVGGSKPNTGSDDERILGLGT